MKKLYGILIVLCILSLTVACGELKHSNQAYVSFYYIKQSISYNEANDVICAENRSQKDIGNDLQDIITKYLSGPQSSSLTALFSPDVKLLEAEQSENGITVTLSKECADMNELDYVLACSCLAKTLLPLTGAESVHICAETGHTEPLSFNADSLLTDADIQNID